MSASWDLGFRLMGGKDSGLSAMQSLLNKIDWRLLWGLSDRLWCELALGPKG